MKDEKLCNFLHDNYCDYVAVTPTLKAMRDLQPENDIEPDYESSNYFAFSDWDVAKELIEHYDLPVYIYKPLDCWLIEVDGEHGEHMLIHRIN